MYHAGGDQHTQNIEINKVIDENEKCVLFLQKKTCGLLGQPNIWMCWVTKEVMKCILPASVYLCEAPGTYIMILVAHVAFLLDSDGGGEGGPGEEARLVTRAQGWREEV